MRLPRRSLRPHAAHALVQRRPPRHPRCWSAALSYSLLRWSLLQDVDASLLTVAQVVRDTADAARRAGRATARRCCASSWARSSTTSSSGSSTPRAARVRARASRRPAAAALAAARANARRGAAHFETVALADGERVRLLTMPVVRDGASSTRPGRHLARRAARRRSPATSRSSSSWCRWASGSPRVGGA